MNEGKMFENSSSENLEEKPEETYENEDRQAELQKVLVDQAKAIMGNVDAKPETLAKMLLDYRVKGQLVGVKYTEDVKGMGYEDFLQVAQKALEEKQSQQGELQETTSNDKPVLTPRDIPDITMDDPDKL